MDRRQVEDLRSRKESICAGDGAGIAKQHSKGKMTARERIEYLLDAGAFTEFGMFATSRQVVPGLSGKSAPSDGVVTGVGKIGGTSVCVYSQDFTVLGGSLGRMHGRKIAGLIDFAIRNRLPVIGLNDSGGARIQEGVESLSGYGEIFNQNVKASGRIPQIVAIMGPCAGGAVYSPALADFIFMVEGTSQMFITGPAVIRDVTGENVSAAELGGSSVHCRKSGVASLSFPDDRSCLDGIRKLLDYICCQTVPYEKIDSGRDERFYDILPDSSRRSYDMRRVLDLVLDAGGLFEIQPEFASNIIIGFGRLKGRTVGVVANQPCVYAGCLDMNSSDKAARFIRFCDSFAIPILTFVDVPGFLPGTAQESGGIIRHGAKLIYAYCEASVPLLTTIVRKAYGGGYIAMASKELGADYVIAWPSAEIAVMGAEGACDILYSKQMREAGNPVSLLNEKRIEYSEKFLNPYRAAEAGCIDDVVDSAETRAVLSRMLEILEREGKCDNRFVHGNMPV